MNKKGETVINAEPYISFAKMSILKRFVRWFSRLWCCQQTLFIDVSYDITLTYSMVQSSS